ncbi:MAG: 50S ribosomal protein L13 [Actinobacteria bacterium 13_2_20CM_2_71_6]|nr:MAG: 50S ribosomal protein L13 [Actinobacteria bacterium 13_2_20CM_2_71_6]
MVDRCCAIAEAACRSVALQVRRRDKVNLWVRTKPVFAPHVDTGDFVIVVNASKVALTGNKRQTKVAYRHSGYPGGLKRVGYDELLTKRPERAIELAVKGMLPHNRLGRQLIRKLKVYAGNEHPHAAQQPKPFEIKQVAQ